MYLQAIVNKKIMVNLVDLFSDQVIIVRKNTLAVFQRVSKTQDGMSNEIALAQFIRMEQVRNNWLAKN